MSDSDDIKAVVRLNADGSMTRVERVSSSQSSDDDWQKLEIYLGMNQEDLDLTNEWRGTDEGGKLKEEGNK